MGYQFVHLESHARKADAKGRSTDFIFAEAGRKSEACIHVENPAPPIVVYGVDVGAVQEIHDTAVAAATIVVKGGSHVRKVAKDKKTLHTVVASFPATMAEIRSDPIKRADAEEWENRTIIWLLSQYGDDLKSVIRHEDEEYFHIHAYIVPLDEPGMSALKYHPGTMAKRAIMDGGKDDEDKKALSKRADAAYKQAMRQWQDSYHAAVAIPCGLTRLGPQRRRLSRDEWQREKVQAKALQQVVQRARQVKRDGENFVSRTKTETAKIVADAAREQEAARKAAAAAIAARDRAQQEQAKAQATIADAVRYTGWAGRLRAVWDGLRKSKLVEKVREEFSSEIDRWRVAAKESERKQLEAEHRRHEAERKFREAQDVAFKVGIERDRLRSILTPAVDHDAPEQSPAPKLVLKRNFHNKEKRDA